MHIRNEPKSLLGEAIGTRLGTQLKVEFTKNTLIQPISEFIQTPPALSGHFSIALPRKFELSLDKGCNSKVVI